MTALTIGTHTSANAGLTYVQNVGRAVRALIAALLTLPACADANEVASVARHHTRGNGDFALYRLQSLASPYDSVMPNLAQELRVMEGRDS